MIESTDFILGEKKRVSISVKGIANKPFEITGASYKLFLGGEVEDSGKCEVERIYDNETILSALIQPQAKNAIYELIFKYTIYPENFQYTVHVRVS